MGRAQGVFSMLAHPEISNIGSSGIPGNSQNWQQEKPYPISLPCSQPPALLELLFSGNVQENCCISGDLSSLSQDKTRLAKNVGDLCADINERESSRRKEFVFHSPQPCS